eukprot:TRINITY_DN9442_c0_g4_i2.p2 TRINITY_DN9442_c0_g4~~TRINITY_DN9442_c0_g4_i2.p2  ORF type:complete len:374 (-),score=59.91 TRINITY_DN9442_c0_g4_i2:339-1460(-)
MSEGNFQQSTLTMSSDEGVSKVNVAFVGAGLWATSSLLPYVVKNPYAQIKAVYSRSEESAKKFAQNDLIKEDNIEIYFGDQLQELLSREDIPAIVMALPIMAQPEMVLKVLGSGKSVLSEKPISGTFQHAKQLVETYEQKFQPQGLVWHVGENYRYEESLKYANQILKSKKLGEIIMSRLVFTRSMNPNVGYYHTQWRKNPEFPGGYILDGGVHLIASLRVIFGQEFLSACAIGQLKQPDLAPLDTISAVLKLEDQSTVSFDMSFGLSANGKFDHEIVVICSQGEISIKRATKSGTKIPVWLVREEFQGEVDEKEFELVGIVEELNYFFKEVQEKEKVVSQLNWSVREALKDLAAVEAMLDSVEEPGVKIVKS